jgi:hypothetical protein
MFRFAQLLRRQISGRQTSSRKGPRRQARCRTFGFHPRLESLESRVLLTGTWATLTNPSPSFSGLGNMELMTDGTVLVQGGQFDGSGTSNIWYKLTPDANGNYTDGAWSTAPAMTVQRRYFTSDVLQNGQLFVLGGEYSGPTGAQNWNNTGEIFDPQANSGAGKWTSIKPFTNNSFKVNNKFGDDPSELLSNGQILTGGGGYYNNVLQQGSAATYLYNSANNTWSAPIYKVTRGGPPSPIYDSSDEETWLKLADGSILTYDIWSSWSDNQFEAERFVPAGTAAAKKLGVSNQWVDASPAPGAPNQPSQLSGPNVAFEMGPAFLLPNGNAIFFGANGNTATYNPTSNTWSGGSLPTDSSGNQLVMADAPGAMMPNGKILLAATPIGTLNAAGQYQWPVSSTELEFDPNATNPTQQYINVTPPPYSSATGSGYFTVWQSYEMTMLVLPTGQVLLSNGTTQSGSGSQQATLEVYTPDGAPSANWQPTITSIAGNGGGIATLTGTQLNGISEGANYGDDAEMATNYPIVKLVGSDGVTRYARTFNWSSTGVQTGSALESVQFQMPAGATDVNQLSVIANGIASPPVVFVSGDSGVLTNSVTLDTLTAFNSPFVSVNVNGNETDWSQFTIPAGILGAIPGNAAVFVAPGVWSIGNSITVNSTLSGLPTSINAGSLGNVTLGPNGTVQGINGPVTIEGTTAKSSIFIDAATDAAQNVTLSTATLPVDLDGDNDLFGQVTGLAPATISYEYQDTSAITIYTGDANTINVLGTGTMTNLVGSGVPVVAIPPQINLGNNGSVQGIQGTLNIDPTLDSELVVDDSKDTQKRTVALGTFLPNPKLDDPWGYISGLAPAHINYHYLNLGRVTVRTGPASNTINVLATGVPTRLVGTPVETGSPNTITIGDAGSVAGILDTLDIENPNSSNTITVDDSANRGQIVALTTLGKNTGDSDGNTDHWGTISGLSPGHILYEYADTRSLTLKTGPADTVDVLATGAPTNIITAGQSAADVSTINIGLNGSNIGLNGSVQPIAATLGVASNGGANVITVDDSSDPTLGRSVNMSTFTSANMPWGSIAGLAPGHINYEYQGTASLTVYGGTNTTTYNIRAVGAATTLQAGEGNDVINLGGSNGLDAFQQPLTIGSQGGTDKLTASDQGSSAAQTYSVNAAVLYDRSQTLGINYTGMTTVILNGSNHGATFNVKSTNAGTTYTLNGGKGAPRSTSAARTMCSTQFKARSRCTAAAVNIS